MVAEYFPRLNPRRTKSSLSNEIVWIPIGPIAIAEFSTILRTLIYVAQHRITWISRNFSKKSIQLMLAYKRVQRTFEISQGFSRNGSILDLTSISLLKLIGQIFRAWIYKLFVSRYCQI